MAEKIPRRMKRFQRTKGKKPEKKVVEKLKGIPKKRQKNFTEKLKIEKESPDAIAETIFEQLKRKEEEQKQKERDKKRKSGKKEEKKIPSEKQPFSKKVATQTKSLSAQQNQNFVSEQKSAFGNSEKSGGEIPLWKKRREERITGKPQEEIPEKKEKEKTEEKTKIRKHEKRRKQKEEIEEETKIDLTELKGTKISGLFGGGKKTKQGLGKKATNELNLNLDLEGMDELEELEGKEGEEEISELDEKDETEPEETDENKKSGKGTCINCKQKFNELIFCSKCGNAFCDKCAKIKHKEGTKTKYVCPHCGNVTKK